MRRSGKAVSISFMIVSWSVCTDVRVDVVMREGETKVGGVVVVENAKKGVTVAVVAAGDEDRRDGLDGEDMIDGSVDGKFRGQ